MKTIHLGQMNKKKIALALVILLIALSAFRIISVKMQKTEEPAKTPVNVQVTSIKQSNIQITTPLSAKVEAKDQVSLSAALSAKVSKVYVTVGAHVEKGTTLFTQDTGQMQGSFDQAKAAVNIAQEGYNSAKQNYDRTALLYKEGAVSKQQYEQAQTQYKTAQQQINQAKAQQSSAGESLSNGVGKAPFSGYITEVNVIEGAFPPQGLAALTIADTDHLELNTSASEYLIGKIKVGDSVSVLITSLPDKTFTGTVTSVAPAPASGSLTYPITLELTGEHEDVMAGMFAEVQVVSEKRENVLCIPSDAVIIKNGESQVAVLDEKNKPSFVPIKTGLDDGKLVEILSGLSQDQRVISSGQQYIIEGEPVNIVNEKAN